MDPSSVGLVLGARLQPGTMLGQYRIEARIGSGAMGDVFRATHLGLQRQVALKVLQPTLAREPTLLQRFRTEAVATARLRHPNILEVTDFAQDDRGNAFLVMELLTGEPFDLRLRDQGKLPLGEAISVLDQVLAALECAHGAGIVHRDLKPSNLYLCQPGERALHIKVLDFGLAKQTGSAAERLTSTGEILGTPAYMAPEQVEGATIDARTDLYAVGCIAYQLLTGGLPFSGSAMTVMLAQVSSPPPPFPDAGAAVQALEPWVMHALEKRPGDRFQRATEMRRALAAAAEQAAALGDVSPSPGATVIDRAPAAPTSAQTARVPAIEFASLIGAPGASERGHAPRPPTATGRATELDLVRAGVVSRWAPVRNAVIALLLVLAAYGLYAVASH